MTNLASPLRVGPLVLRNRVVVPPMATRQADGDGRVTAGLADHYRRLGASGAALVIVEHAYVTEEGRIDLRQLSADSDDCIPGLALLAVAIQREGALAFIQLNHAGSRAPKSVTGRISRGPSGVAVPGDSEPTVPMGPDEIEAVPGLFHDAASRAVAAGFDGVEVHGAHGYLLNQFTSAFTNRRTDAYGGSLEGRLALVRLTLLAVRRALGPRNVLSFRFGMDDGLASASGLGTTPILAAQMAPSLETWGVDLLDCSGGLSGSRPPATTGGGVGAGATTGAETAQGYFVEGASVVKAAASVPVAGVGGITRPEAADAFIREGKVDLVCVGRAHLADPEWTLRALRALGRAG